MAKTTENPSAFKHWINAKLLSRMAKAIARAYPKFDARALMRLGPELERLELKARVRLVRDQLRELLPEDYSRALAILLKSLERSDLEGFDLWPYTEFVQTYGLGHFKESLEALRVLTKRFTAEFAVRPFLIRDSERTLKYLRALASDECVHVRRWVSEGTRPRLPWGERLESLMRDPRPSLELLELLKDDPELYVRKSVANHLNDISKDHPELVVSTLARWLEGAPAGEQTKLRWIRRHALRSLIKQGHVGALELMGVTAEAKVQVRGLRAKSTSVSLGECLEFSFELESRGKGSQSLIVDYVIHHVRANGTLSPKVFKLKSVVLLPGRALAIKKRHALKAITTRRYYPGRHLLEIQVNGRRLARLGFLFRG